MATASEIAAELEGFAEFESYEDAIIYIAQEMPKIEYALGIIAAIALLYLLYRVSLFFVNWIKMFF